MGAARQHIEHFLELWNNGDFDKVQTGMADDQVWVSPLWAQLTGSEAILNRYRADRTAFPDRRIDVSKWVEEGDTVVFEYEWSGTQTGPLSLADGSELAPTGRAHHVDGCRGFRGSRRQDGHAAFLLRPAARDDASRRCGADQAAVTSSQVQTTLTVAAAAAPDCMHEAIPIPS